MKIYIPRQQDVNVNVYWILWYRQEELQSVELMLQDWQDRMSQNSLFSVSSVDSLGLSHYFLLQPLSHQD